MNMARESIATQLGDYLDALVPPRPAEMQAMEAQAAKTGFPIIGATSGYLCYQIARMIRAQRIFEMGSGYGYSTAWFARAVKENGGGSVHHVVWDEELSHEAHQHLAVLGYQDIVKYHVGEAVELLRQTQDKFDLIFNDIDKSAYPESLPVIAEKLRPGGVLIVDNMIWHERIFNPKDKSADTQGVRKFTRLITTDPSWIATLVPVRDGLIVAYKK
jgi:caffeoyl-CoA O-methyltransferase